MRAGGKRFSMGSCGQGVAAVAAVTMACVCGVAVAQNYPVKPVRMVNPFSPGGSLDLVAQLRQALMCCMNWPRMGDVDNRIFSV